MNRTRLFVWMRSEHIEWLRTADRTLVAETRRALKLYMVFLNHGGSKTRAAAPDGYYEIASRYTRCDDGAKERLRLSLWSHHAEWLRTAPELPDSWGNKPHELLRIALDIYITWRNAGFKAGVSDGDPRVNMSMYTCRLRQDQIDWLKNDTTREEWVEANKRAPKSRRPEWSVSEFLREILSVYYTRDNDRYAQYNDVLKNCTNKSPGTVNHSFYIEPYMRKHIASAKNSSAEVRLAIDAFREWRRVNGRPETVFLCLPPIARRAMIKKKEAEEWG